MKEIENVSIAGIAFKLEDEAYGKLKNYLDQIRESYGDSSDGREILDDIEARIAEIILTQQDASVIVSLPLIDHTLKRLGAPEDISDGSRGKNREPAPTPHSAKQIPHRLYRNPEGAKFGGVCSGLAAYFNTDPVWVRLFFAAPVVLLVFFSVIGWKGLVPVTTGFLSTSFLLYFLLWIVIPKAKTPLQKLEMKGETITKGKLEQTFREEFQSRSNNPQNIELRARNERNASVLSEFVSIVGKILLFCIKAFVAVVGFGFTLAVVGIIIALLFVLFDAEAIQGITATSPGLLVAVLGLAVLIPLSLVVYGILKMLFGFNQHKPFVSTLLVIWVLTLVFGMVIFIKDRENIRFDRDIYIGWSSDVRHYQKHSERPVDVAVSERLHVKSDRLELPFSESFPLVGDTLCIVPVDSVGLPANFSLNIQNGGSEVDEPTIVAFKSYEGYTPGEHEDAIVNRIEVEHRVQNDTLYLKVVVPEIPEVADERARVGIFLPEKRQVVVEGGIDYNEYYTK